MERIDAASRHVVAWSAVLEKSPVEATEPVANRVVAPDPRILLEQERARVLEAAAKEGHAQGLKRAEEEIALAVDRAERGVEKAYSDELDRVQSANRKIQELLRSLPHAIKEVDARVEVVVIEAAFTSVLRLLGAAATHGTLIADVCRQALDEYRQRPVVLRVAIDDAEEVAGLADAEAVRVVTDSRLSSGECRLETHKGLYDTGVEVRLEALKQAFLRSFRVEETRK